MAGETHAVSKTVPRVSAARLDELMKAVNTSEGAATVSAMTTLLQALVTDRHACDEMMTKVKGAQERSGIAVRPHQAPK